VIEKKELPGQKVEHENWIYGPLIVILVGDKAKVTIQGKQHNVYPTGIPEEPWTTNIAHASFGRNMGTR
jgi:hypothetical protein